MIEKESKNMNENEKLIQEHFFKKKKESVADKMKKKYGYEPLDAKDWTTRFWIYYGHRPCSYRF